MWARWLGLAGTQRAHAPWKEAHRRRPTLHHDPRRWELGAEGSTSPRLGATV